MALIPTEPPALSVSDKTNLMATATDRQKIAKENSTVPDAGERRVSLLVVEDDENISSAISEYFSRAGYNVKTVEDGLMGVKSALDDPPDAVVLDLMLPKMDGLAVCRELREKAGHLPILMLTAKAGETDRVLGLEMGADDYLTKPFSPRELVARVRAILRRAASAAQTESLPAYDKGGLKIDFTTYEVFARGKIVHPLRQGYEVIIPDLLTVLCAFENGAEGVLEFSGVDAMAPGDRLRASSPRAAITTRGSPARG